MAGWVLIQTTKFVTSPTTPTQPWWWMARAWSIHTATRFTKINAWIKMEIASWPRIWITAMPATRDRYWRERKPTTTEMWSRKLTKKLLAGYKRWRCQMMMITVRHLLGIRNRFYLPGRSAAFDFAISIAFLFGHIKPPTWASNTCVPFARGNFWWRFEANWRSALLCSPTS